MNDLRKYMNILNENYNDLTSSMVDELPGSPISIDVDHNHTNDDYDNNRMLQSKLLQIIDNANLLYSLLKSGKEVPSWVLSKVSSSSENLEGVTNFMNYNELVTEGSKPTDPDLWSRAKAAAKSKYKVYPSAYANGYAAKWYKEKGGSWRKE